MEHQDYKPVILKSNKKRNISKVKVSQNSVSQKLSKLDNNNGKISKINRVDLNIRKAIQKGRQLKGYTQKQLALFMNVKASFINDYEQGKAIPSKRFLFKLQSILDIKLTGKNIGELIKKN